MQASRPRSWSEWGKHIADAREEVLKPLFEAGQKGDIKELCVMIGCMMLVYVVTIAVLAGWFVIIAGGCFLIGFLANLAISQFGYHQPTWVWAIAWFLFVSAACTIREIFHKES